MEGIGDYEYSKKDLIGHGAFAMVFKGRHKKKHDFVVAIKCITKKNLAKSQNLLSKEIKILKELSDLQHENVVQLLDCKETSHHVYLIMEYCNGGDLADYLQAKGTLSEDTISLFLRQIAGAMRALNEKGIVHRDLKPQNILLCHSGNPNPQPGEMKLKIADFGFARFLQDGVMAATLCGSPMYMAPEVIMSLQYDAKADLWSIGTIVYQCLTGKAPFQATTPQQLKQFYEKNANLQPNLPPGTSPELKNLLMGMLRRNARERIDFEVFFQHAFLLPKGIKSSSPVPVPVPRSRSRGSLGESPTLKQVTASPLSGRMAASPPQPVIRRKERPEPMDVGSPPEGDDYLKEGRCGSPTEGFVLVPENIPSDASLSSNGSQRPASVDLNAIFSDHSPDSPKFTHRHSQRASPYGNVQNRTRTGSSPKQIGIASPGRPSTLPVVSPTSGSPKSEPIPVPSQVKAYEQIQRSMGQSPNSPIRHSPSSISPKIVHPGSGPSAGMTIPRKTPSNSSLASIGSISPPQVQFSFGTPPANTWSRRNSCPVTIKCAPQNQNSPFKKTMTVSPRITAAAFNATQLPPIVGSPVKTSGTFHIGPPSSTDGDSPPSMPLNTPFGGAMRDRTMTCPENISAVGFDSAAAAGTAGCIVPLKSSPSDPQLEQRNQSNASRLSEQLLRAAFGGSNNTPGFPGSSSPPGMVVPYGSNTSLNRTNSNTSLNRQRRYSGNENEPYASSPPNMEGPISFVAPELAEDVLMDKEHNDTVAKLNFILALVECVIELAQTRSSPLTESTQVTENKQPGSFQQIDHLSFLSEGQRLVEQLVLYIRALQLLTSSIELAKTEVMAQRLQPSNSVKSILKDMKNYYHQCLAVCKNLHAKGVTNNLDRSQYSGVTADKLIYNYAFEMCQTAVVDEMYGNTEDCFRHYKNAQILLHSLAHQATEQSDKEILHKYREAVEKRLFNLRDQGLINAVNSTFS